MKRPISYRDVITSYLREDTRILASVLATRRVFMSPLHEIYLCIYSGLTDNPRLHDDLVTALIVFKEESIRIMVKLWTDEVEGKGDTYFDKAILRLTQEGLDPIQLIRKSKEWAHLPFTPQETKILFR